MAKGKPAGGKSKGTVSATDHRKMADTLYAKARIHSAKADLADAQNPPKKPKYGSRGYPC